MSKKLETIKYVLIFIQGFQTELDVDSFENFLSEKLIDVADVFS